MSAQLHLNPLPRFTAAAAAIAACALAVVLLWQGGELPGCGGGSPCAQITFGRWSRWWQIPVAAPAAALYLAMAVLLLIGTGVKSRLQSQRSTGVSPVHSTPRGIPCTGETPVLQRWVWPVLTILALSAAGGILWFIFLQLFILRRICPYCMADHALGLLSATIILIPAAGAGLLRGWMLFVPPAIALAVLICGQIFIEPQLYSITSAGDAAATSRPIAGSRAISVLASRIAVNIDDYPLLGPADSQYIVIDLFDYTCPNCRHMHRLMEQARQRYPQMATLLVPVPLDKQCNPNVQLTEPDHVNACLYARYALAVWKSDPARFPEYHRWLYSGERPPPIDEARRRAEGLVGRAPFNNALADPVIDRTIARGIALDRQVRGRIPKLLLPTAALSGRVESATQLYEILEKHLGVRKADDK